MSSAAARLLRCLLGRVNDQRDRILLTEYQSTEWQSLTFVGEQHRFAFRFIGAGADGLRHRFCDGIEEVEMHIPGHVLADVEIDRVEAKEDGSVVVGMLALTIEE